MFRSASLAALLVLGLLAKRGNADVSLSLRIIVFSAPLNALEISWGSCEMFGINSTISTLECGQLGVPMDYQDSSAGNATLAVIKLGAITKKLGTVFFNPGSSLRSSFVAFH